MYYRLFGRLYTVWSGGWPAYRGKVRYWQLGYASYWKNDYQYTKFIRLELYRLKFRLKLPHVQTAGLATIMKGQTMSNAQVIDKIVEDHKVTKTLNLPPPQGSDEVQLTITVQDEEEVEKKPTIH